MATFSATDTAREIVTFTATDTTREHRITNTASVTFGTLMVSATRSTVTAGHARTARAHWDDRSGHAAHVDREPRFGQDRHPRGVLWNVAVVGRPHPATTGANGKVSFP